MKNKLPLKFWWLFFCEVVWRLIAWIIIPFTMPFLKKADMSEIQDKIQYGIGTDIQRYIFPKWAESVDTTDDYFPAGMYEPSMAKMQKRFGSMITGWWNLSTRNTGMSLSWQLSIPVSNYWALLPEEEKIKKGLFDNHYHFLGLTLKVGYVSYRNWKGTHGESKFLAVPRITIRLREKNIG